MTTRNIKAAGIAAIAGVCGFSSVFADTSPPPQFAAADWMIPKICADAAGVPVASDPYPACPAGARLRPLSIGDPLPYRRLDQLKQQYKDLYPRTDRDGTPTIVASFHWLDPKTDMGARFKVWADGYDAYVI